MSYGYNLAGAQTSFTYPSGRVLSTEYDEAGRMAGVRDQQSGAYYAGAASADSTNRMKYAAHGSVAVMKLGNNLWEHTDSITGVKVSPFWGSENGMIKSNVVEIEVLP